MSDETCWRLLSMGDVAEKIEQAVKAASPDGRISCTVARQVARDLDVTVPEVGEVADRLGIKIYGCELGCF